MRHGRLSGRFSNVTIEYRWATETDYDVVGEVIFDAVRNGPSLYSEAQRNAWVEAPRSGPEWQQRVAAQSIAVADLGDNIAGLMSLRQDGYLDFAFIRPAYQGSGIFRKLYSMILELAHEQKQPRILVHASLMAQPAFSAMGFEINKEESVQLNGQYLDRFEMQLVIAQ
jgi:putative acetyltransferase